ncbi:hypothetical protein [Poseidonibacter ostreae]|uniref:Uncharacterized protein n=1 Tax=Poseidonibacter ostreae TaxID=2654171 RepID=A0A6L4WWU1_9BACT|nr:hypothetical protein [Poseidonibacter ostreae]KAB7891351.1 hypothetical protein GBG19_00515 [Poseidonibacter ostreae]
MELNYEDWKSESSRLNNIVDEKDEMLTKTIEGINKEKSLSIGSMGLVHEDVRTDERYTKACREFKIAFNEYRSFNGKSPKKYMQRSAKERREERIKKAKNNNQQ